MLAETHTYLRARKLGKSDGTTWEHDELKTKLSANSTKRQMASALNAQHCKEVEMYKHILGLTTSALILASALSVQLHKTE
jgi:hypothetical protein